MLRPKRVKYGTVGAGRISSVLLVGWLIIGWSRPAFSDEGRHLKLAPIRIGYNAGGSIGYSYQSNSYGTSRTAAQTLDANVRYDARARSYFWQPWFAQVSVGLGVDFSTSASNSSASNYKAANTHLSNEAALDLLKFSRFPFRAHVANNISHASGTSSGVNSDYKTSGFDLTQQYKELHGAFNADAHFARYKGGRADLGTEQINNSLDISLTAKPFKHQSLNMSGGFRDFNHPLKNDSRFADTLYGYHVYQPNSTFSIGSLVNLNKSGYTLNPGNITLAQSDYNSQQLSSYASWRPTRSALTVTSSVRLLRSELRQSINSSPLRNDSSNFNLGANYAWSRLLRTYGSVNVNDSNGIQTVYTNAALSASKVFGGRDKIILGGFNYSRYAGASVSNSTVTRSVPQTTGPNQTTTTSVQNLGGNIGHSLGKSTILGSGRLTINLYQRLSDVLSTKHTPSSHLNSGGTMSWRRSEGKESTILSLRATDSRLLTGRQNFGQIINLQASRDVRLLRHQSLNGNLTIQSSRSGFNGESTPFTTSPSANLAYTNDRLFSTRNLNFNSNLNITGSEIVLSQTSNPLNLSTASTARIAWRNELNYRIGRLEMKLHSLISEINGGSQSSLFFSMRRSF
jgi:hypothetical protein